MGKNLMAYKGIKRVLIVVAGLVLLQTVAIIFQAKWLSEVITALFHHHSLGSQTYPILYFVAAFLIRHLLSLIIKKVCLRFSTMTVKELRAALMETIFSLGPRFTKKEGTGNLVTFLIEGLQKLRLYLELFIPKMMSMGITPWLVLIYIWTKDSLSAIILLVTMPILVIFMILLGFAAQKKIDDQLQSYRLLSNHFVDSLRGLETLKFLGKSKSHGETIEHVSHQYRKATMNTLRIAFLSTFALDFFTMLSVAVVAVTLGLRLIDGSLVLGPALLVLLLAPEYFLPIREVGNDYHATLDGKEAGDKILGFIKENQITPKHASSASWTKESTLTFEHLSVQHKDSAQPSLKNISFSFEGSQRIGVVGYSGAGKSTLIDVLSGFASPTNGTIKINHQEISLQSQEWQENMVYIPQHPFIFQGTLADNIRFYEPDATDEEVKKAIASTGLTGLVNKLSNGVDEMIGEGGRTLSGGQAQRIAVARAFVSKRPVILLDEPTAQLDIETEFELKEVLMNISEDKLLILATHRLHWMQDMDRVLVLEAGELVETGTHEALQRNKGVYNRFITSQTEGL